MKKLKISTNFYKIKDWEFPRILTSKSPLYAPTLLLGWQITPFSFFRL